MTSEMEENGKSIVVEKNGTKSDETFDYTEIEKMLPEKFDELYKTFPLTEETTCGLWIFRGNLWQKFANKKVYVILYGFIGCIFSATYAYFNGTITTLEKRYKIPSRNTGIISVGNDISQLLASAVLSYYAGKGHRPRWMAFGLITIVIFCILTVVPHFLYGPGEDSLALTVEYGGQNVNLSTADAIEYENQKKLCSSSANSTARCVESHGNLAPQVILFVAQFISGIGQPLYYTLGFSYMDDNIQKSKSPTFVSLSYFMRMLGPAFGYTLASMCLKIYISPSLTPTIDNLDPRWLGAWWLGWFILAALLLFFSVFMGMFPKTLPRAAVRRIIQNEKTRRENPDLLKIDQTKASMKDMFKTFRRLLGNVTYMLNNMASLFYVFGYIPYWTFTPKYIETQYRQSASVSNLVTGTVALVFSAIGILLAGFIVTKYRPTARSMASWNVIVAMLTFLGFVVYIFLGCSANESAVVLNYPKISNDGSTLGCNEECSCDFVKYAPVCGENGFTYISGCHAGCKQLISSNGSQIYMDCSCINNNNDNFTYVRNKIKKMNLSVDNLMSVKVNSHQGGFAVAGSCPIDCQREFYIFLTVMCFLKFIGASGRATNFLVSVRCVEEYDKSVAMGFGLTFMALFAFIPSPIFFGWILDRSCIVWGKTCSGSGNCWLYDSESVRYTLNTIASIFIFIGIIFDIGVWYFVKDLKIFDDNELNNEFSLKILKRKKTHSNSLTDETNENNIMN